jgi:heme exporter protein C
MKSNWWKILGAILVLYSLIEGMLGPVPVLPILHETIRNVYFHVPMWFAMIIMFVVNAVYSIRYLGKGREKDDIFALEAANVGIFMGALGMVTGMLWANYTWGEPWSNDPKQNSAAIAMLVYLAYFVLRGSMDDDQKRAKISAVYSVFAFPVMIVLVFILPRLTDSLHPGNGGNPGFNSYDMDNDMRKVFYPAVLGWILMGLWITQIRYRLRMISNKHLEKIMN